MVPLVHEISFSTTEFQIRRSLATAAAARRECNSPSLGLDEPAIAVGVSLKPNGASSAV